MNNIQFPVEIIFWVPGEDRKLSVIAHNNREFVKIMGIYVRTLKSEQ